MLSKRQQERKHISISISSPRQQRRIMTTMRPLSITRRPVISFRSSLTILLQLLLLSPDCIWSFATSSTNIRNTNTNNNNNQSSNSNDKNRKINRKRTSSVETTSSIMQERQKLFDEMNKSSVPTSIWSFESLFPKPEFDEETIQKDLNMFFNSENRFDKPKQFPTNKNTIIPTKKTKIWNVMKNSLGTVAPTTTTTTASTSNTTKIDIGLTQLVEDRVYGRRRVLANGEVYYEYDTRIVPDGAVQFRNGKRLGKPLKINIDLLNYYAKQELYKYKNIQTSKILYKRAIQMDPTDGRAYIGLSKCYERIRDFNTAKQYLLSGIQNTHISDIKKIPTTTTMNNTITTSTTTSTTTTTTTTTASNNNNNDYRGSSPYILQALGVLEEKLGYLNQAEKHYKMAIQSKSTHAASYVALAQLQTRKLGYSAKHGRSIYQTIERELRLSNMNPSTYVYTAWADMEYNKANDSRRAKELYIKAIEIDNKCSAAYLQLGLLESKQGNTKAAIEYFETALKSDPRNTRILQAYAITVSEHSPENSRKAIGLFEKALQIKPRDAGVLQAYALYVAKLGDIDAARDLLQRGTQANKRHAPVWQAWGVLETKYGTDPNIARNIFQNGIWNCGQSNGNQSGGYHCARLWQAWGVLEAKEGDYAAARRCFSRALDANGRNVPAFTAWALMEESVGNIKDARMIFESALKKFSSGSDDKLSLWRSYELMEQRSGDVEAAKNVYQRAMREILTQRDYENLDYINNKNKKLNTMQQQTGDNIDNDDNNKMKSSSSSSSSKQQQRRQQQQQKQRNEVEVVRWQSMGGGEVWINDNAIESKIPFKNKKKKQYAGGQKKLSQQ